MFLTWGVRRTSPSASTQGFVERGDLDVVSRGVSSFYCFDTGKGEVSVVT